MQTRAELSKLHERLGSTFIYVTHDQVEAMTMATRIAVLDKGKLQQVGTPADLYAHPVNRFVAGFIGSPAMNFLEMDVRREGEALTLERPGISIPLEGPSAIAEAVAGRPKVIVGIRPEHLYDPRFRPAETNTIQVRANVELTELMGNEVFVHTTLAGANLLARVDPRSDARSGQDFELGLDYDRIQVFDPGTNENLVAARKGAPADGAALR